MNKRKEIEMRTLRLRRLFTGLPARLAAASFAVTLVALTLVLVPEAALSGDEAPLRAALTVNFTATPTSPGVFSLVANGIGNMSHVGNVFFGLHKTINFNDGTMHGTFVITAEDGDTLSGTYAGVIAQPDSKGFDTFSGQLTFTGGTGRFRNAKGIVSFTGLANLGTGQAVYSLKGGLSSAEAGSQ
jgi:hypothetical protein